MPLCSPQVIEIGVLFAIRLREANGSGCDCPQEGSLFQFPRGGGHTGPRGEAPGPSGGGGSGRKMWARGFVVVSTGRHAGQAGFGLARLNNFPGLWARGLSLVAWHLFAGSMAPGTWPWVTRAWEGRQLGAEPCSGCFAYGRCAPVVDCL